MIYNGHETCLDDVAEYVDQAHQRLRLWLPDFRFLVVTGMSGVIVGSPLALQLNRPLVVIRKPSDDSHQRARVINDYEAFGPYVVVDDFISSGKTYHRVRQDMARCCPEATYGGLYLYSENIMTWGDDTDSLRYFPDGFKTSLGFASHLQVNGYPTMAQPGGIEVTFT